MGKKMMNRLLLIAIAVVAVCVYAADQCDTEKCPTNRRASRALPTLGSVLRFHGLRSGARLCMPRRCLRHGQIGCRRGEHGCSPPRCCDEVDHPDHYGWCARHLRADCRCAPCRWNHWQRALWVLVVFGLFGTGCWPLLWNGWPVCWDCHWHRRWCRCSCKCSPAEALRWCHPDSHLRRSSGSVWPYRGPDSFGEQIDLHRCRCKMVLCCSVSGLGDSFSILGSETLRYQRIVRSFSFLE